MTYLTVEELAPGKAVEAPRGGAFGCSTFRSPTRGSPNPPPAAVDTEWTVFVQSASDGYPAEVMIGPSIDLRSLEDNQGWHEPVAFGGDHLQPGAFVTPVFQQTDTIFTALTVDRNGRINVVWLDLG